MRITSVHGSMTAKNILNVVKENNKKIEEKEIKKSEEKEKKEKEVELFSNCKDKCKCERPGGKCAAIHLRQCSVCHSVLKSQCSKKACRTEDDSKPTMIKVREARKISIPLPSDSSSDEDVEKVFSEIDFEIF